MSRYLVIPKFQEEISDTLSTSTPLSHIASPSRGYHRNEDSISSKSKKVRKKRSAYQKIDDDIRVKLLEAVQQNGETLKSAAKRYGINYSSAKSILHTYRKEGRILKKSAQERTIKKHPDSISSDDYYPEIPHNSHSNQPHNSYSFRNHYRPNLTINTESRLDRDSDIVLSPEKIVSPSSPMNRLSDKFVNILHLNHPNLFEKSNLRSQKSYRNIGQVPYRDNAQLEKSDIDFNHLNFQGENNNSIHPEKIIDPSQINKSDVARAFDNFYVNYSNSPLSSEKIMKNGMMSPNNNQKNKEYDSFSDMISALQNKNSEEIKEEKLSNFRLQNKECDQAFSNENDIKGSIENAAIDTFRTVVDAQLMLCDALKKASYLNNLVQSHKVKEPAADKSP